MEEIWSGGGIERGELERRRQQRRTCGTEGVVQGKRKKKAQGEGGTQGMGPGKGPGQTDGRERRERRTKEHQGGEEHRRRTSKRSMKAKSRQCLWVVGGESG